MDTFDRTPTQEALALYNEAERAHDHLNETAEAFRAEDAGLFALEDARTTYHGAQLAYEQHCELAGIAIDTETGKPQIGPAITVTIESDQPNATRLFGFPNEDHARELRDRVRAAIINQGYEWPNGRIEVTVEGNHHRNLGYLDLAVASSILEASDQVPLGYTVDGKLGLDGTIRSGHWQGQTLREALTREYGIEPAAVEQGNGAGLDL